MVLIYDEHMAWKMVLIFSLFRAMFLHNLEIRIVQVVDVKIFLNFFVEQNCLCNVFFCFSYMYTKQYVSLMCWG